jgi:DNA repair protein RecO (recombination protein O)
VAGTYRDRAVVLRTHDFGEADRVIVLLTEAHGKVRAVAKGVRRTTSRLGSRLQPPAHVEVLFARGRDLDVVTQAALVDTARATHGDLDRLTSGLTLLEAADRIAPDREPYPDLYRMLVGALRWLEERDPRWVLAAFALKLLALEGVGPVVDRCVDCASPGPLVALDLGRGGAQCAACRTGVSVSSDALAAARAVLGGRLVEVLEREDAAAAHELTVLATRALEHHLERRLRSVAVFERPGA